MARSGSRAGSRSAARPGQTAAERLVVVLERLLGAPVPLPVRAWDGTTAGAEDSAAGGPVLVVSSRRAIRRLLWKPDEVGLGRAWVAGEVDIEGDIQGNLEGNLEEALRRLAVVDRDLTRRRVLTPQERSELVRASVLLGAVGPAPKAPPEEASLVGDARSRGRDASASRHQLDVGTDFFRLLLGDSLGYAVPEQTTGTDLAGVQAQAHERICRVLDLRAGQRLLDLGCGWGALIEHAVREHGVDAVGTTLSGEQAEYARKRVADAGLGDAAEIRVQDWREVDDGPYDALVLVDGPGQAGSRPWGELASRVHDLLAPGGRLLVQQVVRGPGPMRPGHDFVRAYVLPDHELPTLGELVAGLEEGGLEVRQVVSLREAFTAALRRWSRALDAEWDDAVRWAGPGRARAWRAFLAGAAVAADAGAAGLTEVLVVRRHADGRSGLAAGGAGHGSEHAPDREVP